MSSIIETVILKHTIPNVFDNVRKEAVFIHVTRKGKREMAGKIDHEAILFLLPFSVYRKLVYSTVSFFPFFSFLPKVLLAFMAIPWESLATTGFYFLNQPWREHILYNCAVNVKYRFYFCRISQVNVTTSLIVLEFKQYLGFRGRTSLLALLASIVTCNVNFSY